LEAHVASEGLAAAEIVAFWLGHPAPHFPEKLAEWARLHSDALSPEFVAFARQAVCSIKTQSELKDLWEEGGGILAPKWHNAIVVQNIKIIGVFQYCSIRSKYAPNIRLITL
jgi:hypothetical protein